MPLLLQPRAREAIFINKKAAPAHEERLPVEQKRIDKETARNTCHHKARCSDTLSNVRSRRLFHSLITYFRRSSTTSLTSSREQIKCEGFRPV